MHMVGKGLFILATISICLALCGCDQQTPTPIAPTAVPTVPGTSLEQVMADFGVYDAPATAGDVAVSRATLDFAVDALEMRDKDLFLDTLSQDFKRDFVYADFANSDTAGLASALRGAKLSRSDQNAIVYSTTVDGLTFEIILIPEGGVWKIDAL